MLNLQRPLVAIDLETTGVSVNTDRILQIAAIRLNPTGDRDVLNYRLNPTIPIPESASAIHSITDADVADCPTFADIAAELLDFIGDSDLAGFNSNNFDIPLLANEFARCGLWLDLSNRQCVDASAIYRRHEPRTLAAAYQFYCGKELTSAHDAMADITATVEVLQGQIERYGLEPDVAALAEYGKQPPIDPAGKIARTDDGRLVLTFGKHAGKPLEQVDRSYLEWMLDGDFAPTTKQLIRSVLQVN